MWSPAPRQKAAFTHLLVFALHELNGKLVPTLLQQYPTSAEAPELREPPKKHAGMFCYPDLDLFAAQRSAGLPEPRSETEFTFVLTDDSGQRQYAFVRRLRVPSLDPARPVSICVTTPFGWFGLFRDMLRHCGQRLAVSWGELHAFAAAARAAPLPAPRAALAAKVSPQPASPLLRPNDLLMPSAEDFGPLVGALGATRTTVLFAELLLERRVAIVSSDLDTLSRCVHAASRMLWPFAWQHVFVPMVPADLLSYVDAPMPFLMGVQRHHYVERTRQSLAEAIVVDADTGEVGNVVYEDLSILPPSELHALRQSLLACITPATTGAHPRPTSVDSQAVADALRKFLVHVFGNYTKFFVMPAAGSPDAAAGPRFDRESFVKAHSKDKRQFLRAFIQSQMFEQFVAEREEQFARRTQPRTQFEIEVERDPAAQLVSPREVLSYYGGKARQTYKKAAKAVRDYRRSYAKGYHSVSTDLLSSPVSSGHADEVESVAESEESFEAMAVETQSQPINAWQPAQPPLAHPHHPPPAPPVPHPPARPPLPEGPPPPVPARPARRVPTGPLPAPPTNGRPTQSSAQSGYDGPNKPVWVMTEDGKRVQQVVFPMASPIVLPFAEVHKLFAPPALSAIPPVLPRPPPGGLQGSALQHPQPRSTQQKLLDIDQFFDTLPQQAAPADTALRAIVFDPFEPVSPQSPSPGTSTGGALSPIPSPGVQSASDGISISPGLEAVSPSLTGAMPPPAAKGMSSSFSALPSYSSFAAPTQTLAPALPLPAAVSASVTVMPPPHPTNPFKPLPQLPQQQPHTPKGLPLPFGLVQMGGQPLQQQQQQQQQMGFGGTLQQPTSGQTTPRQMMTPTQLAAALTSAPQQWSPYTPGMHQVQPQMMPSLQHQQQQQQQQQQALMMQQQAMMMQQQRQQAMLQLQMQQQAMHREHQQQMRSLPQKPHQPATPSAPPAPPKTPGRAGLSTSAFDPFSLFGSISTPVQPQQPQQQLAPHTPMNQMRKTSCAATIPMEPVTMPAPAHGPPPATPNGGQQDQAPARSLSVDSSMWFMGV